MKDRIIERLKQTSSTTHYLRLIVGGYVVYLGGGILWDAIQGAAVEALMLVLASVLVLCGAAIVGMCLYALIKHYTLEETKQASTDPGDRNSLPGEDADPHEK